MIPNRRRIRHLLPLLLFLPGLIYSILTLTAFPFVHSDEVWLAELSREIGTTGNLSATEPFFRLTDRYPHGMKILFHLIQAPLVSHSFSPAAARLPSLLAGWLSVILLALLELSSERHRRFWWLAPLLLSWNVQFLYASHFARQEALLLPLLLGGMLLLRRKFTEGSENTGGRLGRIWITPCALGVVAGLGIFLHPNSFIIALALGLVLVYRGTGQAVKYRSPRLLLRHGAGWGVYAAVLAVGALAAVGLSLGWDPDFFFHYLSFGEEHGVGLPLWLKLKRLPRFYYKMFLQAAGTYYLPDIRISLMAGIAALILRPVLGLFSREKGAFEIPLAAAGIAAGTAVIGKYSPPSLVFLFPLFALALGESLILLGTVFSPGKKSWKRWSVVMAGIILLLSQAASTIIQVERVRRHPYSAYAAFIGKNIPQGAKVLGNLNAGFALSRGALYPFRDLASLESGMSIVAYLRKEGIEWVLWPEEMEIIQAERPVWNDLYGNLTPYYAELKDYLEREGQPTAEGFFPIHAMRLVGYQEKRGGRITLYRLDPPGR